jgi:transcriptional regulator with XRE-family HTH domain
VGWESPAELAGLKRALGRQLAASRQAAEIGQQQLAHKTGYSRSSVAHAEAGRQLLTRDFWKTADELVKARGTLLAGYERVHALKQEQERRSREAELAAVVTLASSQEHTAPAQHHTVCTWLRGTPPHYSAQTTTKPGNSPAGSLPQT